MYYFQKKADFNLENYDFNVHITPKVTKIENRIIHLVLDHYDKQREKEFSEISLSKIELKREEIIKVVEEIGKKRISCVFFDGPREVSRFCFSIFDFFAFEGDNMIFSFSGPLKKSLELHNIFGRIGINYHLTFKNPATKLIYRILLRENKHQGDITFTLEELKDILGIKADRYTRYYDFETKVLNPIATDVAISNNFIWFEKIKNTDSKTGRVVGVKMYYRNLYRILLHQEVNALLREYAEYIEDFTVAYDFLYDYLKKNKLEATKKMLSKDYATVFKA